jgi:outer membrane protein assembly factor BamB
VKWKVNIGSYAEVPLLLDENSVYVATEARTIIALNKTDGLIKWKTQFERSMERSWSMCQTAILFSEDPKELRAIDRNTGEQLWKYVASDVNNVSKRMPSWAEATDKSAYFFIPFRNLLEIDCTNGVKLWNSGPGDSISSYDSPSTIANGKVLVYGTTHHKMELRDINSHRLLCNIGYYGRATWIPVYDERIVYFSSFPEDELSKQVTTVTAIDINRCIEEFGKY